MAEKRMFAKTIIDSDAFLDMPLSTQALYFHLSMRADDDGFVNNPKKIQRIIGCGNDDLKLLIAKKFVIPFESGVCVIRHWRIHNYIQKDRYKETVYRDEKAMLSVKKNKEYVLENEMESNRIQDVSNCTTSSTQPVNIVDTNSIQDVYKEKDKNELEVSNNEELEQCLHSVYSSETQIRLDKISLDQYSIEKDRVEQSTQPPSFPTQLHELIFNNLGEVTYKTWFEDSTIEVNGDLIVINATSDFKKQVIQKYSNKIAILTGKQINVKDLAEVG